ncbi:hypothetical protein CPB97_008349 [Podila verticillata]|nr:hypothetical protein CPB97_008349 [Podila verticillata]
MPVIAASIHPRPHSAPSLPISEQPLHPPSPTPTSFSSSSSSPLTTHFVQLTEPTTLPPSHPTLEAQASTHIDPFSYIAGILLGIIVLILWAMLLLHTLRKRSKSVTKFFLGSHSHSSQCDQESRSTRSRNNTSEIHLSSSQGDEKSLKAEASQPEFSSSNAPKTSSAPLPYISSSKNSSVSMANHHVLYTPSQMLSVPQRIASAPIHVPEVPGNQDLKGDNHTTKDTRRNGTHSDEILVLSHKRALPRALPLTSAPPALTAKQILTAQKVDRVSRLPSRKLLHLFPPPPPPPSSPPPAIPSSSSSSSSPASSPASSPPPSPSLPKSKRHINHSAPCVYLSTPPSTCSSNNASPLLKKNGRGRSQSASATSPPKAKTMIPVPVTSSRSSRPLHPSDQYQPTGGFSSSSSSSPSSPSRKGRHQRSRSSVLDGSNFSAPDLLQHYPTPPHPPSSSSLHHRPRLSESDPLRFPISTPMTVQIPRPVTWTFKGGRPRSPSDTPSTPPMTPPRSRNGSVSGGQPQSDKRRQSVTSNASTVMSHGTTVGGSVSGSSVNTHYDNYDNYDSDYEYVIASHFQQPYPRYKQSMDLSGNDHELHAIITDAIAKTVASNGSPVLPRSMPMSI